MRATACASPTRSSRTTDTDESSTSTCSDLIPAELVGNGMSEANVHQISSRYQKRVKELLDEGSDTSGER